MVKGDKHVITPAARGKRPGSLALAVSDHLTMCCTPAPRRINPPYANARQT